MSLVRRAAGVPPDEFGPRWREQAEKALSSMPSGARPSRLAHCVARPGRGDRAYDGVAISWNHNEEAIASHDQWMVEQHPQGSVLDEDTTTRLRVEERTVSGDGWIQAQWRYDRGRLRLLLIGFIEAAPPLTREQFRDYWWQQHRPLASRFVPAPLEPIAYVHDYVLAGEPGRWAGIGEMYERSLDVAPRARCLVCQRGGIAAAGRRGTLPPARHPPSAHHRP
jgi:EthD domain